MAHFAKLDENNTVTAVHTVNNNVLLVNGVENEQVGINFLAQLHNHINWKQTSYNRNFRKNYAGIGYTYDADRDAFIAPQPYISWLLNETTCQWEAPIPMPDDGLDWVWDEPNLQWIQAHTLQFLFHALEITT